MVDVRAYDIIEKKRDNFELSSEEIRFFINGYINNEIADYQMSAFLMAVYFNGMTLKECEILTECMLHSGEVMDLSPINGVKVDKHSTGGVGDKTTLIVTPIVAACGVKVAKMSGRGLGHTGGTVDKLYSIPGMNVEISRNRFFDIVNTVGCCVMSQSGNLVPADKRIYALRDVTATVDSMPLIASSIMSKKIASGADCIVLDVKVGSGAFMKTKEDAISLSKIMVSIGEKFNKKIVALITDMDMPLGHAIGNSIEVWESCEVLKGRGPDDLRDVSVCLAANMLYVAGKGSLEECTELVKETINSGKALKKLREMVLAQGGNLSEFEKSDYLASLEGYEYKVFSDEDGYIFKVDAEKIGKSAMILGAGREKKEDSIDYRAGIILNKKTGDSVKKGELIATFYSSDRKKCIEAKEMFNQAIVFRKEAPVACPLIQAKVTEIGVENY